MTGGNKSLALARQVNLDTLSYDSSEEKIRELRELTVGIYQLKQAKSYTDEHFDEKRSYEIIAHKEDDGVLKAQIRSLDGYVGA